MPLDVLLSLLQLALIPTALVTGLLLFGAWRARRWVLLTILLAIYLPATLTVAALQTGILNQAGVAKLLPARALLWRLTNSGKFTPYTEETALRERTQSGSLTSAQLREFLDWAASPNNGALSLGHIARSACSPTAIKSPQTQGLIDWIAANPGAFGPEDVAIPVLGSPRPDLRDNPALARAFADALLASLAKNPPNRGMFIDMALNTLLLAGTLTSKHLQDWGDSFLAIEAEPAKKAPGPQPDQPRANVKLAGKPSMFTRTGFWQVRLAAPMAIPNRSPGETLISLPLSPDERTPGLYTGTLTVESALFPGVIAQILLQNPPHRPPGFRQSNIPPTVIQRSYRLTYDPAKPLVITITPIPSPTNPPVSAEKQGSTP